MRAAAIWSVFTRGRTTVKLSPVAGRAKAYTYSHSYLVRPQADGRCPGSDQARRVTGLRPSRASSAAHTSTALPGLAALSRLTRRRKFFSPPAGGRGLLANITPGLVVLNPGTTDEIRLVGDTVADDQALAAFFGTTGSPSSRSAAATMTVGGESVHAAFTFTEFSPTGGAAVLAGDASVTLGSPLGIRLSGGDGAFTLTPAGAAGFVTPGSPCPGSATGSRPSRSACSGSARADSSARSRSTAAPG